VIQCGSIFDPLVFPVWKTSSESNGFSRFASEISGSKVK
jgi:hypothetical protein